MKDWLVHMNKYTTEQLYEKKKDAFSEIGRLELLEEKEWDKVEVLERELRNRGLPID